jgi:hypothetical protein
MMTYFAFCFCSTFVHFRPRPHNLNTKDCLSSVSSRQLVASFSPHYSSLGTHYKNGDYENGDYENGDYEADHPYVRTRSLPTLHRSAEALRRSRDTVIERSAPGTVSALILSQLLGIAYSYYVQRGGGYDPIQSVQIRDLHGGLGVLKGERIS